MIDLTEIPVIDNHVHPWHASTRHISVDELAGSVAFSDGVIRSVRREYLPLQQLAPALRLFRQTNLGANFLRRELARFLAGIDTLLVDEGGSGITLHQLGTLVPVQLRRVARSDNFIRDLLPEKDTWKAFFQSYQEALDKAIADGAIAFKSVIAYRTGLDVQPLSEDEASRNFEASRADAESTQKPFRDFLLCHTMDVARERGLWIHIHAAVGDPDIVYARANPALLYPLLHSERFRTNRVVLVHGGWPWVGEAAAMVAILPNVYLDVSEGAIYGMPNIRQRIFEALEACPYTKILYGADGSVPEALWIVARRFKAVLGRVLEELIAEGFCSRPEAYQAARCILSDNAVRLYGLESGP